MQAQPQQEHKWLDQLVGEWTYESECLMGPDQPPLKTQGTESVRSLGGLWVMCEGQSQMPDGTPGRMIFTFGYDPVKKRFVGTFIGSMMTNLWVYEGGLDAAQKVLTLAVEGPSFTDPNKTAKYQDSIEIVDADHRILYSQVLGDNGQWTRFMTAHYRRVK